MRILKFLSVYFIFYSIFTMHAQTELWGTSRFGGEGYGTIYGVVPGDTSIYHQYNLKGTDGVNPAYTKLIRASNGMLYGLTSAGGESFSGGLLFEYNPTTSVYTKKHDFDEYTDGGSPFGSLVEAPNGKLYGLLFDGGTNDYGTLFEYDPTTSSCVTKINFDSINGRLPYGSLIVGSTGLLYGMTTNGGVYDKGTIFEYDISSNILTKKADFNTYVNGSYPYGDLIETSPGKFYGLTKEGGASDYGTLFKFDLSTSTITKMVDFNGVAKGKWPYGSLMRAADGYLYGMASEGGGNTKGTLFRFDTSTDTFTKMLDMPLVGPQNASGNLMEALDGKLYGVSYSGGSINGGVLFSYDTGTNTLNSLSDFTLSTGGDPKGTLMQTPDGKIYGLTSCCGLGQGTLFEFDISTNSISPKVNFDYAPDGKYPNCGLVRATNGLLYGTTLAGGLASTSDGVIFEYNPLSGIYTRKFSFTNAITGRQPICQMISASNGKLYGITWYGGSYGEGVLYEFDPITSVFIKRFDFVGISGSHPQGSLMQASNGKIYGVTPFGGASGVGVLFEFDPVTNIYTKKIDFDGTGGTCYGKLVQASDGNLYGIGSSGGLSNSGVIFQYNTTTNTFTKKLDLFSSAIVQGSEFGLTLGASGNLYGVTSDGGSSSSGQLFEYNFTTNILTKHVDFIPVDGQYPYSDMTLAANGKLYGTTERGGNLNYGLYGSPLGYGVFYEFDPISLAYTNKIAFVSFEGHERQNAPLTETPCLPITSMLPASDTICLGNNSTLSILATDAGTSYQWQVNTGTGFNNLAEAPPYSSTTGPTLSINNVPAGFNSYLYQCILTTSGGCTGISNSVSVHVNPIPTVSISVSNDTICYGATVAISESPAGGMLLGNGITGTIFSSVTAGVGQHLIIYNYSDVNGCNNSDSLLIYVDLCTAVSKKNSTDLSFEIFPNPSAGKFTIRKNANPQKSSDLRIQNILGKQVFTMNDVFKNGERIVNLDVSFLPPGVYIIQLFSEEGFVSRKLTVQ